VEEAPEAKTTCPEAREPDSLLLKVVQSVLRSWPLLATLALGRLMTRALPVPLVEVEMLKLLPAVPVEMLLTMLVGRFMTKALVVVEMLKTSPAVVVETLLMLLTLPKPKVEVEIKVGALVPLDWRI
jgi:hypothetical protein